MPVHASTARKTPRLLGLGLVSLGVLFGGCEGCQKKAPGEDVQAEDAGLRSGVKVPLPPGWSAQVATDGSFQAGPPGRPALRVDLKPGQGEQMPSSETLADNVRQQMKQFTLSLDQEEDTPSFALLRVTMAPALTDGGLGPEAPAFFGARRVGDDLFLCASLPGASTEEVRLATEACRSIQVQAAPR
ncbi:hypothetical protein D7X55_33665 [Corallococcus sp. AB049A]|uniref:hypothetical protein n=1 Tax=Corallococcus sp. AB049A TaxID=2316721 RepID=UPI000EA30720|nr:hypothetical protein [Corallococcus sp. AB049A]RKH51051.1 hypothetical protein D7Y23_11560 [Corallococcus sp. AB050B]RKI51609.1 hypothetical protein D7X55_33665 [Corallococcus sp. AB049A]